LPFPVRLCFGSGRGSFASAALPAPDERACIRKEQAPVIETNTTSKARFMGS
jgi:hypothetical protein